MRIEDRARETWVPYVGFYPLVELRTFYDDYLLCYGKHDCAEVRGGFRPITLWYEGRGKL